MKSFPHLFRRCREFVLQHDIARKATALLLAVSLYLYVSYNAKDIFSQEISDVNVTLELPPDVVNIQGPTLPVKLQVSGPRHVLNRLTPESFDGRIPVGGGPVASPQSRSIDLSVGAFRKPYGVTIERVTPNRIKLMLDRQVTQKLPIRAVFSSEDLLPAGYAITKVSVWPSEVAVAGPSSLLDGMKQVQTAPVPVAGMREGFDYIAKLQKFDGVSLTPEQVKVHVQIDRKAFGERSLSGLPYSLLLPRSQRDTLVAEPAPGAPLSAEVVVRGPDEKRSAMQKNWIRIFADLSDLEKPGEYLLPLVGVPVVPEARGLEVIRILPEKLRVIVRPRDASALRK